MIVQHVLTFVVIDVQMDSRVESNEIKTTIWNSLRGNSGNSTLRLLCMGSNESIEQET